MAEQPPAAPGPGWQRACPPRGPPHSPPHASLAGAAAHQRRVELAHRRQGLAALAARRGAVIAAVELRVARLPGGDGLHVSGRRGSTHVRAEPCAGAERRRVAPRVPTTAHFSAGKAPACAGSPLARGRLAHADRAGRPGAGRPPAWPVSHACPWVHSPYHSLVASVPLGLAGRWEWDVCDQGCTPSAPRQVQPLPPSHQLQVGRGLLAGDAACRPELRRWWQPSPWAESMHAVQRYSTPSSVEFSP